MLLASLSVGAAMTPAPTQAQITLGESFDSPETSWRNEGGNVAYQVEYHRRIQQGAHSGSGCEYLQFTAGNNGTRIYFSQDMGRGRVIPELTPSIWLRADRPGLQLFARVVLPRTLDPRTGQPISRLIPGDAYDQVGQWKRLTISGANRSLAQQARALRAEFKVDVDTREAYLDQLVLNAYGGPGRTRVWLDDLEVAGFVEAEPRAEPTATLVGRTTSGSSVDRGGTSRVELAGSVLVADGHPLFVRSIEHQGEPFAFLKSLGFNAVQLGSPPSPALLEEAAQAGLWLICPPPKPAGLDKPEEEVSALESFSGQYQPVLAWHLGRRLAQRDLEPTRNWVQQIRRADGSSRPLVCEPEADLKAYSRIAHVLITRREPLGTAFELADYGPWLKERLRLARPGTPGWTVIQTQLAPEVEEQIALFSGSLAPPAAAEYEQLRLLTQSAIGAGMRGLLFASRTPLDGADVRTRTRAMALELLNLELDLVQPWICGGSLVANVPGSVEGVTAAVLQTDRTRLLLPLWTGSGAQFVPSEAGGNRISFVAPGAPDSSDAFEITPSGLRALVHQRQTGGVRVTLDEFSMTSRILLAHDPLAISALTRKLIDSSPRAARLCRDLAAYGLQRVSGVEDRLTAVGQGIEQSRTRLAESRASLRESDASLARGDYLSSWLHSERALRPLRLLQRAQWQKAANSLGSPVASPCAVTFVSLPEHWMLAGRVSKAPPSRAWAEGDFEDLNRMLTAGWRHYEHAQEGVTTEAELSPRDPRRGKRSLRLSAHRADPDVGPTLIETAPLWVTSPELQVSAGQLVRVHGWARITAPITGSVDGLMIIDSLGGEALAERLGETKGWREFSLYRVAPADGSVHATLALTGLGEVRIDDFSLEVVEPPVRGP